MDRIGSNPYFNPTQLYQKSASAQRPPQEAKLNQVDSTSSSQPQAGEKQFSDMFGDNELLKLQSNLEAIAQMAENALKRFDG